MSHPWYEHVHATAQNQVAQFRAKSESIQRVTLSSVVYGSVKDLSLQHVIDSQTSFVNLFFLSVGVRMYVCMHVCMSVCMYCSW